MHPIDQYVTIQRRLEELRCEAEYERMLRVARIEKWANQALHRRFIGWLGVHMVNWGHKLEQFGTVKQLQPTSLSSPHH